jgi:hypothetical protein
VEDAFRGISGSGHLMARLHAAFWMPSFHGADALTLALSAPPLYPRYGLASCPSDRRGYSDYVKAAAQRKSCGYLETAIHYRRNLSKAKQSIISLQQRRPPLDRLVTPPDMNHPSSQYEPWTLPPLYGYRRGIAIHDVSGIRRGVANDRCLSYKGDERESAQSAPHSVTAITPGHETNE